jgi:hypothetical protein
VTATRMPRRPFQRFSRKARARNRPARKQELLVVIPTRGRPEKLVPLAETASERTLMVFCVDDDDPAHYEVPGNVLMRRGPRKQLVAWTNEICRELGHEFRFVGSIGDDHLPRTEGWDSIIIDVLKEMGTGFCYPNDLFQGEVLPTACFMTQDIIEVLGFMAPPQLRHMYCDNYWLQLGRQLGRIRYLPDVIVEHVHFAAGKAPMDQNYLESQALMDPDREAFESYMASHFAEDLAKVKQLIEQ